jgi:hypothetical protein
MARRTSSGNEPNMTRNHLAWSALLLIGTLGSAPMAIAQTPSAAALTEWVRRGYDLATPESRGIWRELGWSGVGFGFRTFAAREAASEEAFGQQLSGFAAMMEYYRIRLDELHTSVDGDIGLVWGVHTEEFQIRGRTPEAIRVRFTNALRWDGQTWRNLLMHRDAQVFDASGRYIPPPE